jgi:hypothetical protein
LPGIGNEQIELAVGIFQGEVYIGFEQMNVEEDAAVVFAVASRIILM